jgi:thermolysin
MRGSLTHAMSVVEGGSVFVSDLASDSDNDWSDVAVVDAHVHVSWAYDYYFKRFGRTGLDGHDTPIHVLTNAVSQQGALSLSGEDFSVWAVNAFWCGGCGPNSEGIMVFGNGMPSNYYLVGGGQSVTYLAGALDIAVHELTHAVTQFSSRLIYRNESGALNEAFSDIMGTSAEFFYHPPGGLGQADYLMGEDSFRASRPGSRSGIRSMENPGLFGDPDHYTKRNTRSADNGGVHTNSGIPNQAFYLAIEGGTNRTSGLSVQGVGAGNRGQIERVFYRAFVSLLPPNATFSTARAATVRAAQDLYGSENGAVERAVTQAWSAVGVF